VDGLSVEPARNRHVFCGVLNCLALGLQLVDMMVNSQPVFRTLFYTAHNACLSGLMSFVT